MRREKGFLFLAEDQTALMQKRHAAAELFYIAHDVRGEQYRVLAVRDKAGELADQLVARESSPPVASSSSRSFALCESATASASFIFIPREYSLNGFVSGRSKRRICS